MESLGRAPDKRDGRKKVWKLDFTNVKQIGKVVQKWKRKSTVDSPEQGLEPWTVRLKA